MDSFDEQMRKFAQQQAREAQSAFGQQQHCGQSNYVHPAGNTLQEPSPIGLSKVEQDNIRLKAHNKKLLERIAYYESTE